MRSSDFLRSVMGDDWITVEVVEEELIESVRKGTFEAGTDLDAAIGLLDFVQEELEAFGTSGGEHLNDQQSADAILALEAVCARLDVPLLLPFRNYATFRAYWMREGASGSGGYQKRRDMLESLFGPTRRRLRRLESLKHQPLQVHLDELAIMALRDPAAIHEALGRIQRVAPTDPALAIGTAKELVESTAKVVLIERGRPVNEKDDLPALVSQAQTALGLHPSTATIGPDGTDAVKKILGSMITATTGLAELRNRYGTGHGAAGVRIGLRPRHAHLAVNTAITWCRLMLDTLADPDAPWRKREVIGSTG
jgi:abortive infection Abi-like protein